MGVVTVENNVVTRAKLEKPNGTIFVFGGFWAIRSSKNDFSLDTELFHFSQLEVKLHKNIQKYFLEREVIILFHVIKP